MSAKDIPVAHTAVQKISPFKYWVQTTLPTIFDDSLSYMELLNKVVKYLNSVIEAVNALNENGDELFTAFQTLRDYVDTYFDNLDISSEVREKLDEMSEDGRLTEMIRPILTAVVKTDVTEWLNENVSPTGSMVLVDKTLTIEGAGADAKVVGERLTEMGETMQEIADAVPEVDSTLTVEGAAADAKVVGDEVRGLADGLNSARESIENLNTEMDGKVDENRGDLNYGVLGIRNGQVVNDTWPEVTAIRTHAGLAGNGVSFEYEDGRKIRMWGAFPGGMPIIGFQNENVEGDPDVYITGVADPMADKGAVNLRTMNRALATKVDDQPGPMFAGKYLAVNNEGRIEYVPAPENGLTPEQLDNIDAVPEKMDKKLYYMGTDRVIRYFNNRVALSDPYHELLREMFNKPSFVVVMDNDNRIYHPELLTPEQIVFTCVYPMDSLLRVSRITISNENLVTTTTLTGENRVNKIGMVKETGDVKDNEQYPSVTALRGYAEYKNYKRRAYTGFPDVTDPKNLEYYPSVTWVAQMVNEKIGVIENAIDALVSRAEEVAE